jgi:hypothetical protein
LTCVFTVAPLNTSSAAISALESPRATSVRTSRSRGVSSASCGGGMLGGAVRANCSMSRDDVDRGDQLLGRHVLEQEAACARAQRLVDVLVEVERRQHEHGDRIAVRFGEDPAGRLQPVEPRHLDVHEHDVGTPTERQVDGVEPVGRLAHDRDAGLGLEDRSEARAHEGLVVGDQHRDRLTARRFHGQTVVVALARAHAPVGAALDRPAG